MRKWTMAALAAGGLLASLLPDTASAQRAGRGANRADDFDYNQDYEEGAVGPRRGSRAVGQPGQTQPGRGPAAAGGQRYLSRRVSGDAVNRQPSQVDRELASWLTVDNRGEIALAELAREKASNSDVREFAETMIDEHSKMVEQLQPFTGVQPAGARSRRRPPQSGEGYNREGQALSRGQGQLNRGQEQFSRGQEPFNRGQGQLNIVRLKQQLGEQCVSSASEELGQKEGDEFDKCYVGMQIAKHMEMLDTLKVFAHYASEDLDQLIEEAEDTTQQHLEHAKDLIKQLEQGGHGHASSHSGSRSGSDATSASSRSSTRGRSSAARSGRRASSDLDDDSDDDSND